eukprot:TRINITY_DN10909_c0_g1_i2.p1 TRINITY_DN10909_c0_g1~~TRINITY_DN10909_c0_g1_i2.p1  ORF type:complete len:121 (-),score=21.74 TRINITY_DN10909_c0_g1_i2:251-613(-)
MCIRDRPSTLSPVRSYATLGVNSSPARNYEPSPIRSVHYTPYTPATPPHRSSLDESQDMIKAFHKRQESPAYRNNNDDGPSIIQDERRRLAEQSRLSLDEYRNVARKEAHDFSPERSPGR